MNSMTRIISRALVASLLIFIAACSDSGDVALTKRDDNYLYVNLSQVVDYDIEASNGVIHVIDSVLLPPDLTASTMTIAEIAQADGNFDTLVAALTATNLVGTVNDPDAALTVFAPTDAAFEALDEASLNYLLLIPPLPGGAR